MARAKPNIARRFAVNDGNAFGGSILRVRASTAPIHFPSPLRSNEFVPAGQRIVLRRHGFVAWISLSVIRGAEGDVRGGWPQKVKATASAVRSRTITAAGSR